MFPSWIRSRNCRPRLVYFFAIEITRRRFASVISRFARRAFASPVDICLLMSLRSFRGMPIRFWIVSSFCCCSRMFGSKRDSRLLQGRPAAISFFTQRMLVSLPGSRKRGALALAIGFFLVLGLDVVGELPDRLVFRVRVDQTVDQFVDAHLVAGDLAGKIYDFRDGRRAG